MFGTWVCTIPRSQHCWSVDYIILEKKDYPRPLHQNDACSHIIKKHSQVHGLEMVYKLNVDIKWAPSIELEDWIHFKI